MKVLRKARSLRQEDLADECGVTRQTIIAVENDRYDPSLHLAMRIAQVLEASVEDIFHLDDGGAAE